MWAYFSKMHVLGNDFVIIDQIRKFVHFEQKDLLRIANRHFGIGCDQIIFLEPPKDAAIDLSARFINQDGSNAEFCGNGLLAAGRYIRDSGLVAKDELAVATEKMVVNLDISSSLISLIVNLRELLPEIKTHEIMVNNIKFTFHYLKLTNPHAVCFIENLNDIDVSSIGAQIANKQELFPEGTNVEFIQVLNPEKAMLRVFERGVGYTNACGSGAMAAVVAGEHARVLSGKVILEFEFGAVVVEYVRESAKIILSATPCSVYLGKFLV